MTNRGDERRDFRRMHVAAGVRFRREGESDWHAGETRDLSATGLSFRTDRVVPEGGVLEVEVAASDERLGPLRARLAVLRVEALGDGDYEVAGEMQSVE